MENNKINILSFIEIIIILFVVFSALIILAGMSGDVNKFITECIDDCDNTFINNSYNHKKCIIDCSTVV